MYTNSSMSKTSQFLSGIVTVLILAALVLGCKPNVNNGTATAVVKKFPVAFSVEGKNGSLAAKVDGNTIDSGTKVEEDKTVTFTVTPRRRV